LPGSDRITSTLQFKHAADRLPVAVICSITLLDLVLYLSVDAPIWLGAYFLLMLVPKGVIGAWNHHHQHTLTFKADWLNRLYEIVLALHTGVTTHVWLLHHVLGHHLNYLDQRRDESRWQRRDGTQMGVVEYTLNVAATAYWRAFRVGQRHPKHQRVFLTWTAITLCLVAALTVYRPLPALFLFILPMITGPLYTSWVTYDHHAGLDTQDPFEASYNIVHPLFNRLTGNLGYHTAHHHRQGVHWSKLPALHARIAHRIPAHLYRESTFFPARSTSPPAGSRQAPPATAAE
jgi:fatty acid desaturase